MRRGKGQYRKSRKWTPAVFVLVEQIGKTEECYGTADTAMCSYVTKDFRVLICVTCQQDISGNIPSCCVMLACIHGNPNYFTHVEVKKFKKKSNTERNTQNTKNMAKYPKESKTIDNYHKQQCFLCYLACMALFKRMGQAVLCLTS